MILKINNTKFSHFNKFVVTLRHDAVASSFSFDAKYSPENPEHAKLLQLGRYAKCTVEYEGETLITGTILNHTPKVASTVGIVPISGYSKTGVLEDCNIPVELYPLQSDKLTLKEIADKICKYFGLSVSVSSLVTDAVNSTYDVSNAKETQTCKAYLAELVNQKNVLLSHTSGGNLLFTRANATQRPVMHFEALPTTEMALGFNGQALHSTITVLGQADFDLGNAKQSEVTNPYVNVKRPKVLVQNSGTDVDTEQAAKNALADELRNITLTITTDRWKVDGQLIRPNTIITATSAQLGMKPKTKWFVEEVTFTGGTSANTAVLKCVLPECYNGETPSNVFS